MQSLVTTMLRAASVAEEAEGNAEGEGDDDKDDDDTAAAASADAGAAGSEAVPRTVPSAKPKAPSESAEPPLSPRSQLHRALASMTTVRCQRPAAASPCAGRIVLWDGMPVPAPPCAVCGAVLPAPLDVLASVQAARGTFSVAGTALDAGDAIKVRVWDDGCGRRGRRGAGWAGWEGWG